MTYINHMYLKQEKEPLLIKISGTVEEALKAYIILKKEFGEFDILLESDRKVKTLNEVKSSKSHNKYELEYKKIPIDLRTDPIRYTKEYHLLYYSGVRKEEQIIAKFRGENSEEARKCVEFLNRMDEI